MSETPPQSVHPLTRAEWRAWLEHLCAPLPPESKQHTCRDACHEASVALG